MQQGYSPEEIKPVEPPPAILLAIIAGGFAFLYVVPTLLEKFMGPRVGFAPITLLWGDLAGCLAVGYLFNWKLGGLLYTSLALVKVVLLQIQLISPAQLMWFSDAIPMGVATWGMIRRIRLSLATEPEPPDEY